MTDGPLSSRRLSAMADAFPVSVRVGARVAWQEVLGEEPTRMLRIVSSDGTSCRPPSS